MGFIVERAKQKLAGRNVISIEPRLRERQFQKEHHWHLPVQWFIWFVATFHQVSARSEFNAARATVPSSSIGNWLYSVFSRIGGLRYKARAQAVRTSKFFSDFTAREPFPFGHTTSIMLI
jgi:hypothetical protein